MTDCTGERPHKRRAAQTKGTRCREPGHLRGREALVADEKENFIGCLKPFCEPVYICFKLLASVLGTQVAINPGTRFRVFLRWNEMGSVRAFCVRLYFFGNDSTYRRKVTYERLAANRMLSIHGFSSASPTQYGIRSCNGTRGRGC